MYRIVDTTLRDGEQMAGIELDFKDKIEFAKIIDLTGVYQIEAGTPAMEGEEKKSIEKLMTLGLKSKISAWNRMNTRDIQHSIDCGVDIIHIAVPSSDIQLKWKLGKDKVWIQDQMKRSVYFAKERGFEVVVGFEDAKIEQEAKKIEIIIKSEERIDNIVKYFLTNCIDITPLALQKLLYYAQGFHKIFNGEYLFNNNCEAWVHGPVYRNIYDKYKSHVYNPIENSIIEFDNIELSESEKEILNSIIINFGCYSGKILEKMTHIESPWRTTRIGLNDNEISNRIIEKELIADYFEGVKSKYNMFNIFDIRDYSMDLFQKIHN